jgi:hypothetical protein
MSLNEGDIFGEEVFLIRQQSTVTVRAARNAQIFEFGNAANFFMMNEGLYERFLKVLCLSLNQRINCILSNKSKKKETKKEKDVVVVVRR